MLRRDEKGGRVMKRKKKIEQMKTCMQRELDIVTKGNRNAKEM